MTSQIGLQAFGAISVSLVLVVAGVRHLAKRSDLGNVLAEHGILGPNSANFISWVLPPGEIVLGVAGVAQLVPDAVWNTSTVALFTVFAAYLAAVHAKNPSATTCGCGIGEGPPDRYAIGRAFALAAMSLLAAPSTISEALSDKSNLLMILSMAATALALAAGMPGALRPRSAPGIRVSGAGA